MKFIANVSWGKDSLAMLLLLLQNNSPLDEVVFFDTGMEFDSIYNTRDKMLPILKEKGITYTELKSQEHYMYYFKDKPVKSRKTCEIHYGYSWCGGRCRWYTSIKTKMLNDYCKNSYKYIGIAYDEQKRIMRNSDYMNLYPLNDLKLNEKDCLKICYENGFEWLENDVRFYNILDRVSCWCCANKNLKELKNIMIYLPNYWERLKELQSKTERPMKGIGKSIFDLEKRFMKEIEEKDKNEN